MAVSRRTRRIATVAAYGGGSLGAVAGLVAAFFGVLLGESKLARRRIPAAFDDPPPSNDTTWVAAGVAAHRSPIRLAVLGDSSAAGYGVSRDRDTLAAQLAIGISAIARRPVHVRNVAKVGAVSQDVPGQIDQLGAERPELAVILIGTNDVTHRIKPAAAIPHLIRSVERLRTTGAAVVVGTCPDLGTVRPLAQPLRRYARHLSRRMAKEQTIAVVAAGGRTVSLGDLLGPLFATQHDMFSDDQFHPSANGYAAAAGALVPSALDALGYGTRAKAASTFLTRRPKPVAKAAAQAASRPGSEVAASSRSTVGAAGRAARGGTWAQLRRRRARTEVPASPERATSVTDATRG